MGALRDRALRDPNAPTLTSCAVVLVARGESENVVANAAAAVGRLPSPVAVAMGEVRPGRACNAGPFSVSKLVVTGETFRAAQESLAPAEPYYKS
jgi:hypothetical protein